MGFYTVDDGEFQAWTKEVQVKAANPTKLKMELQQSLKRVGVQAQRRVSNSTPVDTGNLRRGWTIQGPFIGGAVISIQLSNNVEYAPFIENGHRTRGGGGWVPGRFMLRDSIEAISGELPLLLTPGFMSAMEGLL
ncbi:HK97 gp10 family phage protein [Levilactobacillus angrenensis]|uniref:HK97 gp10 family phage protein n=1 Tax=Levilactobacillus angrenensis TaxID=2486020 RepID=A0ABW1UB59_9LACO|nr:HK97 gp10 family phage protein [Levilactobacillus angrenensis]